METTASESRRSTTQRARATSSRRATCPAFAATRRAAWPTRRAPTRDDETWHAGASYNERVRARRRRPRRARRRQGRHGRDACSSTAPSSTSRDLGAAMPSAPRRSRSTTPTRRTRSPSVSRTPAPGSRSPRAQFLDRLAGGARRGDDARAHRSSSTATAATMTLERAEDRPTRTSTSSRVGRRRARRHPHADLHVGHHRQPEGRADHAPQHPGAVRRSRR